MKQNDISVKFMNEKLVYLQERVTVKEMPYTTHIIDKNMDYAASVQDPLKNHEQQL